jgi:hypothetical protein
VIDESVAPVIKQLEVLKASLDERMVKGRKIVQDEQAKKPFQDVQFIESCEHLLNALDILTLQVDACIEILNENIDLIAQEGDNLLICKRTDAKAMELFRRCTEYCDVIITKQEPNKLQMNMSSEWKIAFGNIKKEP